MQDTSAVIIVAAGSSRRMSGRDKLWMSLNGRIILARTIDIFDSSPLVDIIILVVNEERRADATRLCEQEDWRKITAIASGGTRRQDFGPYRTRYAGEKLPHLSLGHDLRWCASPCDTYAP